MRRRIFLERILGKRTRGFYRTGTTSGANYTDLSNRLYASSRIIGKIGESVPPSTSRRHFDSEGPEIARISSATPRGGLQNDELNRRLSKRNQSKSRVVRGYCSEIKDTTQKKSERQ